MALVRSAPNGGIGLQLGELGVSMTPGGRFSAVHPAELGDPRLLVLEGAHEPVERLMAAMKEAQEELATLLYKIERWREFEALGR